MPLDEWQNVAARVSDLPLIDKRTAQLRRALFSAAEDLKPDRQGRILISQRLREFAGIENEVIIAGSEYIYRTLGPGPVGGAVAYAHAARRRSLRRPGSLNHPRISCQGPADGVALRPQATAPTRDATCKAPLMNRMASNHDPVLADEVLAGLNVSTRRTFH